jgi:site-specific DNA recombinase
VTDGIETGTKLSKLTLSVKAIFNEQYLDDLRERTLRGLHGRFARGLHTGGRIYGYRSIPRLDPSGRLDGAGQPLVLGVDVVVAPEEACVIVQIFDWFAEGFSARAIAHRLNAQAVPFPAERTRRGPHRKGWAQSAVRVILLNEKYRGRWVFGSFFKDPVSGRRRARLRPEGEWQTSEHPERRIITDALWETAQARFATSSALHHPRQVRGRLAGRTIGSPSSRGTLFSGLLRCGCCSGGMVVVAGGRAQQNRRYGCGFHRDKGPEICSNGLTVPVVIVEGRLLAVIRERVLQPEAVQYFLTAVNGHLDRLHADHAADQDRVEAALVLVETELKHIEDAIVSGLVGETTAALLRDREGQRTVLRQQLAVVRGRPATGPMTSSSTEIRVRLTKLENLLRQDVARANGVFREMLTPITLTPVASNGNRFYRAAGEAKGAETLERLGYPQAFDFGGCGGPQPLAGKPVAGLLLRDPDLNPCFSHDHVFTKCLRTCAVDAAP